MFKLLKKYAQYQKQKAYRAGFGWAISAYCLEGYTIPQMIGFVDDWHLDSFDRGVLEAVRLIEGYPIIKEYAYAAREVNLSSSPTQFVNDQRNWWRKFLEYINRPGTP